MAPMADAQSKWLIGCAVGCGALLLLVVAVILGGALFVRDTVKGFESAVDVRTQIEERFGETGAFTPWPDGVIPAERIETFLGVRDATSAARAEITRSFSALPLSESEARELDEKPVGKKVFSMFGIMRSALGLGAELGLFFESRNDALLQNEMGLGEYTYLYSLVYYAWIGHSPDDGPQSLHAGQDEGAASVDFAGAGVRRRIHDELLSMLRNQLASLGPDAPEKWRDALDEEIAALENDRNRYPWQDGLPEATSASLEPFRSRLEAAYDPVANEFELTINKKQGRFSIQAE
jgi:hypothetical protein